MSKLWLVLLTLCLGLSGGAQAGAEPSLYGAYHLTLSGDAAWHHHSLKVASSDSRGLRGTISIDWGLGPEARAPRPDERVHTVPFEGRWDKSGAVHIDVTVGHAPPVQYQFELYPMGDGTLVGVVRVERTAAPDAPASAGPWRHGVLARKGVATRE